MPLVRCFSPNRLLASKSTDQMLAAVAPSLLFLAFLLLLLVSFSVPVLKTIYLFRLVAEVSASLFHTSATGAVRFGVWGYCTSGVDISIVGINHDTSAQCSQAKLGYNFDSNVASALHVSGLDNAISRTLTAVLVLHPIACVLTFIALIASLFTIWWRYTGLLAALVTTVVFLVDVIFVAVVRHRINSDSDGVIQLSWGNAVWLTLVATVAIWGSLVGACASLYACGRWNKSVAFAVSL
ncbi:pH-response regulator protein palI/prr-5 [Grifola frondosa]|uniref:pH-response regulator protein palI/prr-5 n=1 Tax=Grifola frondosa TaxID=5627 RepID=A0A1C7MEU5_GRIFR|nr:pH-response regulator protein palI/prr-5 [Grifola frondosa]